MYALRCNVFICPWTEWDMGQEWFHCSQFGRHWNLSSHDFIQWLTVTLAYPVPCRWCHLLYKSTQNILHRQWDESPRLPLVLSELTLIALEGLWQQHPAVIQDLTNGCSTGLWQGSNVSFFPILCGSLFPCVAPAFADWRSSLSGVELDLVTTTIDSIWKIIT